MYQNTSETTVFSLAYLALLIAYDWKDKVHFLAHPLYNSSIRPTKF